MKVYRGPISKPFLDSSHEFVAQVSPEKLVEGITSDALIQFNITKEANERQAICTAQFEEHDLIPMISGLLTRLTTQIELLTKIKAIIANHSMDDDDKIEAIRNLLPIEEQSAA